MGSCCPNTEPGYPSKITKNDPQKLASPKDKGTNVNIVMKHEPDMESESKILPHSLKA